MRLFVPLALAGLVGCPSSKPARSPRAEVEISGEVELGSLQAAAVRVYASKEDCASWNKGGPILGDVSVLPKSTPRFMLEVFVPQGTVGNVCGLALNDAG